ncbi:MAG: T9SS type A sorting domain-containing protein [Chlorobi bacterium]|nr:T9SS type A sorting domain-containing protein [Chlorobiota bacterium]
MKRYIYKLALTLLASVSLMFSNAQTFESRVIENDYGYLVYQMRETSGTGTPTTSTNIVDITFVVRYPSGAVDIDLICSTNDYNIVDGLAGEQTSGSYDYHYWNASNTPFNPPSNWTQGVWEDIALFKATGATGSGLFEVAPDGFDGRDLNWNQDNTDYTPTVNGSVTYSYPTIVYDLVWTGADATYPTFWDVAGNWETSCGGSGTIPNTGNNCVVPVVANGNYPINIGQVTGFGAHQPICDYLRINNGASMSIDNQDFASTQAIYTINNNLKNLGTLTLVPEAELTVSGSTYIDDAVGFVVQANASGIGSFIDNGTITYGSSGTAKVQTYLSNSSGAGNFDIHFVGPTVDEASYTGGGTGAFLSAFDLVNGSTYAYSWDESVANANGWQNLSSNTYEVRTANGIGLSTTDNTNHTLEMTGALITGAVSSPALTYSNNHYELISNPYPSAIDFDALAGTDNSTVVQNKYWIWDPSAGSYITRSNGSSGTQYIQVGQGFMVETKQAGTFDFTNARRSHSNDAFRETIPNELTIFARGGMDGYQTEAVIRFEEEATNGYDIEWDAEFWPSQNSDATSIRSVTEDGVETAINMFPPENLASGSMFSVPLKFDCGYTAEYILDFSGFGSFEYGTEIYLEDTQTGADWVYLNENPLYTFDAAEYQSPDRFILHFFGPTNVNEIDDVAKIDIFSSGQYAYVRNNTQESIKMIYVYNLASKLVMSTKIADGQKLSSFWVSDQVGYYIIKVVTGANIYTEKVLIYK